MLVPEETSAATKADQVNSMAPTASVAAASQKALGRRAADFETESARRAARHAVTDAAAANAEVDRGETSAETTFFEVAVRELAREVQRDRRIVALVQHDLMEHFLAASTSSDR